MSTLRFGLLLAGLLLVPVAAAQDPTVNETDYNTTATEADSSYLDENATATESTDPSVNESDYDTTAAPDDESYLDVAAGDPTVTESDFDMNAPSADQSYLDEAERESTDGLGSEPTSSGVPAPGVALTLAAAVVAIGFATRRR